MGKRTHGLRSPLSHARLAWHRPMVRRSPGTYGARGGFVPKLLSQNPYDTWLRWARKAPCKTRASPRHQGARRSTQPGLARNAARAGALAPFAVRHRPRRSTRPSRAPRPRTVSIDRRGVAKNNADKTQGNDRDRRGSRNYAGVILRAPARSHRLRKPGELRLLGYHQQCQPAVKSSDIG